MSDVLDEGNFLEAGSPAALADAGKIVTARGTEDGLVLRIDGRAEWGLIIADIEAFLGGRKKFFEGGIISLEWMDRLPTEEQGEELEKLLGNAYGIQIAPAKKAPVISKKVEQPVKEIPEDDISSPESQFVADLLSGKLPQQQDEDVEPDAVFDFGASTKEAARNGKKYIERISDVFAEDVYYDDNANARVVYGTLRSGQRIETPFNLIVVGDVNPGADLVAGGDIIIFGSLRGTAHASAYDDTCFDRVIISQQMRPTQLRIGSIISRGSDEAVGGAEIARIENRRIVVESFNPRSFKRTQY